MNIHFKLHHFLCIMSPVTWEHTDVPHLFIKFYWDYKNVSLECYEEKNSGGLWGAVVWLILLREEMECVWDGPFPQMPAFLEEIPCHWSSAHREHLRMITETIVIILYLEVHAASQKSICLSLRSQTPQWLYGILTMIRVSWPTGTLCDRSWRDLSVPTSEKNTLKRRRDHGENRDISLRWTVHKQSEMWWVLRCVTLPP